MPSKRRRHKRLKQRVSFATRNGKAVSFLARKRRYRGRRGSKRQKGGKYLGFNETMRQVYNVIGKYDKPILETAGGVLSVIPVTAEVGIPLEIAAQAMPAHISRSGVPTW